MAQEAQRPIRVAVIGTGSLGQHHARIYAEMAAAGAVEFSGIYDANTTVARGFAEKYSTRAFSSIDEAAAASDALNIVTPTVTHFTVASQLLQKGKHLLVEKPMTETMEQAGELVQLAEANRCLVQVGHIERFNPVFKYLEGVAKQPRFIEAHRTGPHPGRNADVGVVLDLMIHDLDIVLTIVNSPVVSVDAVGVAVLSKSEDIANVRLKFANGCTANITASRISENRMRKIRVFSGGAEPSYISLDYRDQKGFIYRVAGENEPQSSLPKDSVPPDDSAIISQFAGKKIVREPVPITKEEPLKLELQHFVNCVRHHQKPLVDGEAGMRALELAFEIMRQINASGVSAMPSAS